MIVHRLDTCVVNREDNRLAEEPLKTAKVYGRGIVGIVVAGGIGLTCVPTASADPVAPVPGPVAPPASVENAPAAADVPAPGPAVQPLGGVADPGSPAVEACSAFANALDSSSTYYGDFADTIEGTARPDYGDREVSTTNVSGRTALRAAAASAMNAAGTPGLSPDIANPMRTWSLGATKLLLKMGLRTGGQSLNDTATSLNNEAANVQMACAAAGTHA